MSRLETVRESWTDITDKLLHDKQLLAHFLRFSASMYKQSFSDAALRIQQNRKPSGNCAAGFHNQYSLFFQL